MFACQRIFDLNDELAAFVGVTRRIGDLCHFAAYEQGSFLQYTLIKLIIGFVRCAHINVEVVDHGPRALMDKMGELQPLHTANDRAIVVEILIA